VSLCHSQNGACSIGRSSSGETIPASGNNGRGGGFRERAWRSGTLPGSAVEGPGLDVEGDRLDFPGGPDLRLDRRTSLTIDSIVDFFASAVAARLRAEAGGASGGTITPRLLTVDQAAIYLGRTKEAVQHMVAARKLPVVRDGRRVFLDVRELDGWIEQNKEAAEV